MNAENEVYLLSPKAKCTLSGAAYVWNDWEDKVAATDRAVARFSRGLEVAYPSFYHWLFIGHRNWQRDDRIVRHRKLWSALRAKGVRIPIGQEQSEIVISSEHGIKYFGLLKCDSVIDCSVGAILRSGWETQLVFASQSAVMAASESLLLGGFEHATNAPPEKVIDVLCGQDVFAYLPIGWFDDRRSGCALIAKVSLMVTIFPGLK
jgi:hypothetical protein